MKIIQLEDLDSTNQYVKENYLKLNHFDCIYTKNQLQGRGRKENHWYSNSDSLTFSLLIKDDLDQERLSLIPFFAAKVLHQALTEFSSDFMIKWPNDILYNHKKIAGILVETVYIEKLKAVIIGVGLNLNNDTFPQEIEDKAISLKKIINKKIKHLDFLKNTIALFDKNYNDFKNNQFDVISYCNQYHSLNNQLIYYYENKLLLRGQCLKIEKNGHLQIIEKGNIKSLVSGQVNTLRF